MTLAIIRGANGRRHEVDFEDGPVAIEVGISDAVVEIVSDSRSSPLAGSYTHAAKPLFST